jgi:hypothetical protein
MYSTASGSSPAGGRLGFCGLFLRPCAIDVRIGDSFDNLAVDPVEAVIGARLTLIHLHPSRSLRYCANLKMNAGLLLQRANDAEQVLGCRIA